MVIFYSYVKLPGWVISRDPAGTHPRPAFAQSRDLASPEGRNATRRETWRSSPRSLGWLSGKSQDVTLCKMATYIMHSMYFLVQHVVLSARKSGSCATSDGVTDVRVPKIPAMTFR